MKKLEETIGYTFKDASLLTTALTHSSYINEHGLRKEECNERLEFLGDAVLETLSSEFLYRQYPEHMEGSLSKMRSMLVCEEGLSVSAHEIGLGQYLMLGKGADREGARDNSSVLSDAFEALIAALYLDGGMEEARKLVYAHVLNNIEDKLINNDAKTLLQEELQGKGKRVSYELVSATGPDHARSFVTACLVDGTEAGKGEGRSKKQSEQEAAKAVLLSIRNGKLCI